MSASARRVAQLYTSSRHVAARWLLREAGLMQAPPAMHEAISQWVRAVVAATTYEAIAAEIGRENESVEVWRRGYADARKAIAEMRAAPTSWKVYKEFSETMDRWGGEPYSRRSVRDFQKLTPERREDLLQSMTAEIDRAERNIDMREKHLGEGSQLLDEQKALRRYMMPGVGPMSGEEVSRKFKIDTDGWRYGTQEYRDRLLDAMRSSASETVQEYRRMLEEAPAAPDDPMRRFFERHIEDTEKMIESGNFPGWKEINVTLALKAVRSEAAYWSNLEKTIRIVVPSRAYPYQLTRLDEVLEHELVHFAQSWLSAITGHTIDDLRKGRRAPAGLPSRDIQTPEFQQHMDPSRGPKPEVQQEARRVLRKLQQVGVNPRLVNWHDLDDVEFYSELGDAVREFKKAWGYADLDESLLRPAIKHFTFSASRADYKKYVEYDGERYGPLFNFPRSKFFQALKTVPSAKGKFQKALSELVKAVL